MTNNDIKISQLAREEKNNSKVLNKRDMDRRIAEWQMFFLYNLNIFVKDILGVKLKFFQEQLLLLMWESEDFMFIGSRGIGKTFLVAIFCLALCLLLPNYTITVGAKTLNQANLIIEEKIKKILTSKTGLSKTLSQLVKDGYITFTTDRETGGSIVEFLNGSRIVASAVLESMRGKRTHMLIIDEACLIKRKDYESIAEPLCQPYDHNGLHLEPKKILMTSPRDKNNWVWTYLKKLVHDHYKGHTEKNFFACDIYCAVANGIQTIKQFYSRKSNTDEFAWATEYLCLWQGDSEDAIFKRQNFIDCQVLNCNYYPYNIFYSHENIIEYNENEVRFLCADLALSGGQQNDLTVLMYCICDTTTGNVKIEYIKAVSGMNANEQVKLFKREFKAYNGAYFVYDAKGLGIGISDIMMTKTYDDENECWYDAWTVDTDKNLMMCSQTVLDEKLERTSIDNALPVMIPIVGTTELNSQNHYNLWSYLRNKKLELLKDAYTIEYEMQENNSGFVTKDSSERAEILLPYLQTDLLINEACNLEITRNGADNITVKEKGTNTKDRFMCLGYACAFANKLYNKYQGYDDYDFDIDDYIEVYNM